MSHVPVFYLYSDFQLVVSKVELYYVNLVSRGRGAFLPSFYVEGVQALQVAFHHLSVSNIDLLFVNS